MRGSMKKRYSKIQTMFSGIQGYLSEYIPLNYHFVAELRKNWDRIAGKAIADHSAPIKVQNETLLIHVDDNMWIQELSLQSEEIKYQIFSHFKEQKYQKIFHSIRFKIGEIIILKEKEPKFKLVLPQHKLELINKTVSNVEDPELKKALKHYLMQAEAINQKIK